MPVVRAHSPAQHNLCDIWAYARRSRFLWYNVLSVGSPVAFQSESAVKSDRDICDMTNVCARALVRARVLVSLCVCVTCMTFSFLPFIGWHIYDPDDARIHISRTHIWAVAFRDINQGRCPSRCWCEHVCVRVCLFSAMRCSDATQNNNNTRFKEPTGSKLDLSCAVCELLRLRIITIT